MTANKKVHLTDDIEAAAFPFGEKMDAEEIIRTADIFAGVRFEDLRETIELKKNGEEKRIWKILNWLKSILKEGENSYGPVAISEIFQRLFSLIRLIHLVFSPSSQA